MMNTHADKNHEHKSRPEQAKGNQSAVQLRDNRPKSVLQKMQEEGFTKAGEQPPAQMKANASVNGITHAENENVKQLTNGSVDLHSSGAEVKNVSSGDPKLKSVGARSMAVGGKAFIGNQADRGHEIWHLAQQAQGRVRSTTSVNGQAVNDSPRLEHEADRMGARVMQARSAQPAAQLKRDNGQTNVYATAVVQRAGWEAAFAGFVVLASAYITSQLWMDSMYREVNYTAVIANIPTIAGEIFAGAENVGDADPSLLAIVARGSVLARNAQMLHVRQNISAVGLAMSSFMKSQGLTYEKLYETYKAKYPEKTDAEINKAIISSAARPNSNLLKKFIGAVRKLFSPNPGPSHAPAEGGPPRSKL